MAHNLDRVVERACGFDDKTRNALVHLAAQELAGKRELAIMRSHTDRYGRTFDLYRDRRSGKVYITRRPILTPQEQDALRTMLATILDEAAG